MPEAPYNRSWLFHEQQDVGLAAEAVKLARVFADMKFVRAANPDSEWLRDWSRYVDYNARTRHTLDGLLLAYAITPGPGGEPHGFDRARTMAGQLEVFTLASPALECQVFEHPTQAGGQGYIIAFSGFASDLMATVAWALPTICFAYQADEETPTDRRSLEEFVRKFAPAQDALRDLDESLASHLRLSEAGDARLQAPISILPAHDEGSRAACATFLLAHEFSHVTQGDFDTEAMRPDVPPQNFLADLPDEIRREVEADCAAFTLTMNALIVRDGEDPRIPDFRALKKAQLPLRPSRFPRKRRRQEQAQEDARMLMNCVNHATEACLSFYAVTELLSAVARHRGDEAQALRFGKVSERRDAVRGYMQWIREGLEETWGVSMWHPEEARRWAHLDRHIDHLSRTLVPTLGHAPPPRPPGVPDTFRRGTARS
ncbi:hypothetical protein [Streptomyces sp. NBC_01336]|uniref:hypothetical protein n=1 Tax=unclassified Streptomyces TaxID=2593676 RepID=UPI002E101BA4|nr:hypothetical protein OG471_00670 [Streptomyces sp. NBC_01336]